MASSNTQIRIPEHHYSGLSRLLHLDEMQLQSLVGAFQEKIPTLSRSKFITHVIQQVELDPNDVSEMLEVLISLYSVRVSISLSTEEFIDVLCRAMKETDFDLLIPSDGDWEPFRTRLKTLLSFDQSLGAVSKASFIFTQHTNVFHEAKLFTDIRPVFNEDPEPTPIGGMLVHKLRISYISDGEMRDFFVALDNDDIQQLRFLLDRAELKSKSINTLLQSASMLILESDSV